jgi:hypothetical protein
MRKALATITLVLSLFAAAIRFAPQGRPVNPPVNRSRTIEANMNIPANVSNLLEKSCKNCHSYQTEWPWYSRVAPMSWLIAKDVREARKAVNFSDWTLYNGRRPGSARGTLAAACAGVQSGRMPPSRYTRLHPEARVSAQEAAAFCAWTSAEIRELRRGAAGVSAGQ